MRFKGVPVMEREVPRSGASYEFAMQCELARVWSGETVNEWDVLDGDTQARIIATYQAHMQLEAVIAHDSSKKQSQPAPAPRRRRRR